MQDFAFEITDNKSRIALLSGSNDNEVMWVELEQNIFEHVLFPNIHLEIYPEGIDKMYNYMIDCTETMFITLLSGDLREELSDKYNIRELMNELVSDTSCKVINSNEDTKSVILNVNGNDICISEINTQLMKGKRKKINIRF